MWFCLSFAEIANIDKLRSPILHTVSKEEAYKQAILAFDKFKSTIIPTTELKCIIVQIKGCTCCRLSVHQELLLFSEITTLMSQNEKNFTDWVAEIKLHSAGKNAKLLFMSSMTRVILYTNLRRYWNKITSSCMIIIIHNRYSSNDKIVQHIYRVYKSIVFQIIISGRQVEYSYYILSMV